MISNVFLMKYRRGALPLAILLAAAVSAQTSTDAARRGDVRVERGQDAEPIVRDLHSRFRDAHFATEEQPGLRTEHFAVFPDVLSVGIEIAEKDGKVTEQWVVLESTPASKRGRIWVAAQSILIHDDDSITIHVKKPDRATVRKHPDKGKE